ncbi:MAG: 30S ribosomal protein S16 [Planctomycetota bacterium]
MVKIRLQKLGRRNRAFFRIVVTDVRVKRQGEYLEKLGHYDPIETKKEKQVLVNMDRYNHWINHGAQATEAVSNLVRKFGGMQGAAAAAPAAPVAVATK